MAPAHVLAIGLRTILRFDGHADVAGILLTEQYLSAD
jgi:hypothetical protein